MDDIAVPQHHRVGAHRARRHPALAVAVPVAVVAVIAGVFVWAILALVGGGGDEPVDLATATPLPTAADTAAAGTNSSPSSGAGEPTASNPAQDPGASASAPASPESSVDRGVPVDVLNSTAITGLAATGAEQLTETGWQVNEVGNYGSGEIPTAVFYNGAELAGTAAAVVEDLGAGTAQESAEYEPGTVTVVLGSDYSPS